MKAYLTKYALTEGIKQCNAFLHKPTGDYRTNQTIGFISKYDIHKTHEAAVQRAEEMRLSEIERLQKEINRLENLKF